MFLSYPQTRMQYFNSLSCKEARKEFLKDNYIKRLLNSIESDWCDNLAKYSEMLSKALRDCRNVTINDIYIGIDKCIRVLLPGKEDYHLLDAGGFSEGTVYEYTKSDRDVLYISARLSVYDTIQGSKDHILMVIDERTPGYAKLQLVQDGNVVTREDDNKYKSFCRIKVDKFGRPLLSNKFHYYVLDSACTFVHDTQYSSCLTRHGPAVTHSGFPSQEGFADIDNVDAFFCSSTPFDISKLTYLFKQDELQNLNSLGCIMVPVGSTLSEECEFQWRISFNLQERAIIRNFNDTQHKCLVLLKGIRYKLLKPTSHDIVRSYHCKMAIFHIIAEHPKEIWIPENLIHCTLLCLERLRAWISNEHIPNFFIPDENTLKGEMLNARTKHRVLSVINDLITYKFRNLLKNVDVLCIDFLLTNYFRDGNLNNKLFQKTKYILNMFKDQMQEVAMLDNLYKDESIICLDTCVRLRNCILVVSLNLRADEICETLHQILVGFANLRCTNFEHAGDFMFFQDLFTLCLNSSNLDNNLNVVTEYSKTVIEKVAELLQPIIHILLGTFYSTTMLNNRDVLDKRDAKIKSKYHFERGMIGHSNFLQVNLVKASTYLALGKHAKCKELLDELAKDSVRTVSEHMTAFPNVNYRIFWNALPRYNLSDLEICYTPLQIRYTKCFEVATYPVAFSEDQSSMVPLPVVYEMYKMFGIVDSSDRNIDYITNQHPSIYRTEAYWLNGMCLIDASFYMYYLQYVLFQQIKKQSKMSRTLHKMEDLMGGDILFANRDTAWNLLGDIYRTKRWNHLALKCFRVSLQIKPKYNAAKWHIAIMFLQ